MTPEATPERLLDLRPFFDEPHAAPDALPVVAATELPLTERDRRALLAVTRMRLLSYEQLQHLVYRDCHASVVSRRMRQLARQGWVRRWRLRVPRGGHPTFVLPTRRALAGALPTLRSMVAGTAVEQLVDLMLPEGARKPLVLAPDTHPPFLAHQKRVNDLLVTLETSFGRDVLWASSWDRPLPLTYQGIPLPQPDFVLVVRIDGQPRLVLGELDLNSESISHFAKAKIQKAIGASFLPEVTAEIFGFPEFRVVVCASAKSVHQMRLRIERLSDVINEHGAAHLLNVVPLADVGARPAAVLHELFLSESGAEAGTCSPALAGGCGFR